jgi:hypothetical protein
MSPATPALVTALKAMPSRHSQVLVKWRLEAMSREALAQHYGVDGVPLDALLLRAARDFQAALAGASQAAPLEWTEEERLAAALRQGAPEAGPLTEALEALSRAPEATLAALRELERAAEASPARRREMWLRRLAVVVILALTGYFYLHDHPQEAAELLATLNRLLGTRF